MLITPEYNERVFATLSSSLEVKLFYLLQAISIISVLGILFSLILLGLEINQRINSRQPNKFLGYRHFTYILLFGIIGTFRFPVFSMVLLIFLFAAIILAYGLRHQKLGQTLTGFIRPGTTAYGILQSGLALQLILLSFIFHLTS